MKQNQPSHSPGPWKVTKNDLGGFVIVDSHGFVIAEIQGPYTPSFDRYEEDAQLIAAAPNMLAALRLVDAQAEALIGEKNWYDSGSQAADLMRIVRDAISQTVVANEEDASGE